ncbi:MAG: O-antigen ligase family protein [Planctomycetota bacterium]|nr:MAG: O-antigen ligase family protein [Planctomycetota bacterium]
MKNDISEKAQVFLFILLAFWLPLSLALSEIFYSLAFVTWIIAILARKNNPLHYTGLEVPTAVFAIAYIAAILASPSPMQSAWVLRRFIKFGLIFLLANNFSSKADKLPMIRLWLLGAVIASVWTIIEYVRGVPRPGGFFGPITFGYFAPMFLGVSLSLAGLKQHKRISILSWLSLAVGIPALVLTCTRGGWIGFIASLVFFLIVKRKWFSLTAALGTGVLVVAILSTYFPNSELGIGVRSVLRPFDEQVPRVRGSNLRRWYKWKASWQMFKERPLFGIGPHRFKEELPNYLSEEVHEKLFNHQSYAHAHSIYFDYLATMGITGLLGALFFIFMVFRLLISKYKSQPPAFQKSLALGVLMAFISFCVGGLFHQCFHRSQILLNLCFLLGLVL